MSPFERTKAFDAQLRAIVSSFDIDAMQSAERDILRSLKSLTTDVRLDMRDYGMAETRQDQARLANTVRKRLEQLERIILKAGSQNLVSAIDVAQLSAEAQQIIADL